MPVSGIQPSKIPKVAISFAGLFFRFSVLKIPLDSKWRHIRIPFLFYSQSCIVISDGLTNASDKKRLERTSKQLKKIAKVIAVGVRGKNYSKAKRKQQEEELKMIATDKNKDFFIKDDFGKLKKAVDPIAKRACPLTYRKKGPWVISCSWIQKISWPQFKRQLSTVHVSHRNLDLQIF